MKKAFFILILTVLNFNFSNGQTSLYHPFPDSNAIWIGTNWHKVSSNPPCVAYDDYNLFISGDTTIGAYTYHKLYQNGTQHATCPPPGYFYYYGTYWGAFRQDVLNKQVYLYKYGQDTLAYDFNLNVGDTLPVTSVDGTPDNIIVLIDSVLVGTSYRKRFWLNSVNPAALIEGIGSTYGAFSPIAEPFESGSQLSCVRIDTMNVWSDLQFGNCRLTATEENDLLDFYQVTIPNPFLRSSELRTSKHLIDARLIIYNVFGQVVLEKENISGKSTNLDVSQLTQGIYLFQLIEGRNVISAKKILILN